jgi:hypothetical protein
MRRRRTLFDANTAEIVCEVDDSLAVGSIDLVGAAVGDKGAVELELSEWQFLQSRQGGIAAAEFVDREPDVEMVKLFGQTVCQCEVVDDVVFGDIDDQRRPFFEFRLERVETLSARASLTSAMTTMPLISWRKRRGKSSIFVLACRPRVAAASGERGARQRQVSHEWAPRTGRYQ